MLFFVDTEDESRLSLYVKVVFRVIYLAGLAASYRITMFVFDIV
jgi:hypothetical protein